MQHGEERKGKEDTIFTAGEKERESHYLVKIVAET
jgi:hypothetical protein